VIAGASLLAAATLLGGCGSSPSPTPGPTPPTCASPGPSYYNEQCLIDTFGNNANFLWGSATAAAQIEGAWNVGDKQPSIWDDFCHSIRHRDTTDDPFSKTCGDAPEGADAPTQEEWTTLDRTDDFYHTYEADLDMLSGYNMNALRISLSWPRLMPLNNVTGQHEPSADGIKFYNDVLDKMIANGITPVVTLFHWDLPNDLSFLEDNVVEEFAKYAQMAFENFHTKVSDWATFNEPTSICSLGYSIGAFAPGHKSTTDHLVCAKNLLLSHARAYEIFKAADTAYTGQIGIVLDYKWTYPEDPNNEHDTTMAQWDRDNVVGIWADPIFGNGDFPESMKTFFGASMPVLSEANQTALRGSADFYGANSYGGKSTKASAFSKPLSEYEGGDDMSERYSYCPCNDGENKTAILDIDFECGAASGWLWARPDSMYQYLKYINTTYSSPKIYVTEFGGDVEGESQMEKSVALADAWRVTYYQRYMMHIARAKIDGCDIQGVFAWSLMDNFEWGDGLNFRFGITYVNFTDMSRTAKDSAKWWQELIPKMNPSTSIV